MAQSIYISIVVIGLTLILTQNVTSHDTPTPESDFWMHPKMNAADRYRSQETLVESGEFWWIDGQRTIESQMAARAKNTIEKVAKNVVFFLGDGMGVSTITAARIFKGQEVDKLPFGEEGSLHMDSLPHVAVSRTFCSDAQVADSACSATAFLGGVKTNIDMLGVKPALKHSDCQGQADPANHVSSILAWAQAEGKSTGVVTTTRITHATPAGSYAHAANRDWESDKNVIDDGGDPSICRDIAYQLVMGEPGKNINVILGGGRRKFLRNNESDPEAPTQFGERQDNINLIDEWKKSKNASISSYVTLKAELENLDTINTDFLLGLFAPSDINFLDEQEANNDPSLELMTRKAIEILQKNPRGFFLLVEGGRIDHAHHAGTPQRAMWETIEFDKAIKTGDDMTEDDETLLIVTADHSHVMTIAGYPARGTPIKTKSSSLASDRLPYATLSYANGPGGNRKYENNIRPDITNDNFEDVKYVPPAAVPLSSETHAGEDVLILSKGPYAHLLNGVQQQSYVAHVMGFASCSGSGIRAPECTSTSTTTTTTTSNTGTPPPSSSNQIKPYFYFVTLCFAVFKCLVN